MAQMSPRLRRAGVKIFTLALIGAAALVGAPTLSSPASISISTAANATEFRQSMQTSGTVFSRYRDQYRLTTAAGQQVEVGRVNLPAGNYTISAKMYPTVPLPSGLKRNIRCVLSAGGDFDQTVIAHDGQIESVPIVLNVAHAFTAAGPAILTCGYDFIAGDTFLRYIKVTAIPASALNNAPL